MSDKFKPRLEADISIWKQEIHESILVYRDVLDEMKVKTFRLIMEIMVKLPCQYDSVKTANDVNDILHKRLKKELHSIEQSLVGELDAMVTMASAEFISTRVGQLSDQKTIQTWKRYVKSCAKEDAAKVYDHIMHPPIHLTYVARRHPTWK